ncbi:MAG: DNA topoisomerase (ATP-hydrolyzing) [Anaerolineaceae bacterium]
MEVGLVRKVDIDTEMQQSYLDYAMSVIVSRALPDARDGLKPVQRRILYAMYDMGLRADSGYRKSARIVGEVLGKYHPHGDVAVYEAMARLAQDFSMRYPLVNGQGNFGSVDGDPPAAMRYTEARLMPFALELLAQIDRNTVDFERNFDDTMDEPVVLPAAAPNLMVNGASGIAVGMATNIPPHNLAEVVDALVFMLKEWEKLDDIAISDLMQYIKGPDFPTGGIILQENGNTDIQTAYATGRGRISVRGKVHAEEMGRGRSRLIITELPYMTNKASLVERIAELVREGGLEGIVDLRDESDRQGMRIVIELSKSADTDKVLLDLYKRTPLQSTFSIALLALVEGEPRLLSLKQALKVYLEHRLEVVRRRSEFDLAKAQQRAHILEGLRVAINNLDEIIAMIRNAPDVDAARTRLVKRFKLTDIQAQAILDMQLRRLAALERKKIEEEYKGLLKTIKDLEVLLKSPRRIREMVGAELLQARQTYGDTRRTHILELKAGESAAALLTSSDLTPAKEVWAIILPDGTAARTSNDQLPRVSGRQAAGWLLKTDTHHTLYIVNEEGKSAAISVDALPVSGDLSGGAPVWKISPLGEKDEMAAVFSVPPRFGDQERYIVTATRLGMVKKTFVQELPGPSAQLFTLVKVNGGDALAWAGVTDGESELFMVTEGGMAIRFAESEVRAMGLATAGVNGIKLKAGDAVAGVERLSAGDEILIVASNGRAWRTPADDYPLQGRYGQGVIACKLPRGVRCMGILVGKRSQAGIAHYHQAAARLLRVDAVAMGKRAGPGAEALPVKATDSLIRISPVMDGFEPWIEQKKAAPRRKPRAAATTGE